MFKKVIIALAVAIALPVVASAQKFGTVDVNEIFTNLPETKAAQTQLAEASKKYEDEFKKLQDEFDKKLQEYQALGQDAPASIKERREQELQELSNKIQQFRNTASQDLEKQNQTLLAPIQSKISDAIKAVGQEGSFTFIFENAMPIFSGKDVIDVTSAVKNKLGISGTSAATPAPKK